MMGRKKKSLSRPQWLVEFREATRWIDILDMAFDSECNCPVVQELRKYAIEYGERIAKRMHIVPPGRRTPVV